MGKKIEFNKLPYSQLFHNKTINSNNYTTKHTSNLPTNKKLQFPNRIKQFPNRKNLYNTIGAKHEKNKKR